MTTRTYAREPAPRAGGEAYRPARRPNSWRVRANSAPIRCTNPPRVEAASPACTRRRDDRGAVPVELVIIAPVLAVLLAVLVLAWRVSEAGNQVTVAAAEAARAASLERDVSASAAAGEAAARRTLEDRGLSCTDLDVDLDVSSYEPGGHVTATVSCTAELSDLDVPGAPGSWTTEASFTEPIEQYRGG